MQNILFGRKTSKFRAKVVKISDFSAIFSVFGQFCPFFDFLPKAHFIP